MRNLKILMGAVGFLLLVWLVASKATKTAEPTFAQFAIPQDPKDLPALVRSSHQLFQAVPGYYRSEDVVAFLRRLSTRLDDAQFRAAIAPAFFAWINVRSAPEVRVELAAAAPVLLQKFARTASVAELESMVSVVNQKSYDEAALEAALSGEAARPVTPGGWGESRAGLISVASLAAQDYPRAKRYLQGIKWEEPATAEDRQSVTRLSHIVDLIDEGRRGPWTPAPTVQAWQSLATAGIARTSVRPLLEQLAFAGLKPAAGSKAPSEFVKETAKEAGAADFWDRVVNRCYAWVVEGTTQQVADFESLVHEIGASFARPGYESLAWTRAAAKAREHYPNDPGWPAKYLERAAATASDDAARATVVKELAACYIQGREFTRARRAVDAALAAVKDEKAKAALGETLKEVLKKEKEDQVRVAKAEKQIEQERLRGELDFMKKQLATARSQKKPSEDIQSLERIVRQLEHQVTE